MLSFYYGKANVLNLEHAEQSSGKQEDIFISNPEELHKSANADTMSHDEIGNYDGSRLIPKLMVPMLNMNNNIELYDKDRERASQYSKEKEKPYHEALDVVRFQKAQLATEKLAKMLQTGELDKYAGKDYHIFADEVLIPLDIKYSFANFCSKTYLLLYWNIV